MVYRLLPLMMVGLMEYKFMGVLTGSEAEKELAMLFEKLLAELRDQTQGHYDALSPLFAAAPADDQLHRPPFRDRYRRLHWVWYLSGMVSHRCHCPERRRGGPEG